MWRGLRFWAKCPKSTDGGIPFGTLLKRRATVELLVPRFDLLARQRAETVDSKLLATETAHDRSVDHGAPQLRKIDLRAVQRNAAARQIAHETASETVARAGGVEHAFQQISRRHEVALPAEDHGAVLAALDHQRAGTHLLDLRGRSAQVLLTGEQARFAVVDEQEVPVLQGLQRSEEHTSELQSPMYLV